MKHNCWESSAVLLVSTRCYIWNHSILVRFLTSLMSNQESSRDPDNHFKFSMMKQLRMAHLSTLLRRLTHLHTAFKSWLRTFADSLFTSPRVFFNPSLTLCLWSLWREILIIATEKLWNTFRKSKQVLFLSIYLCRMCQNSHSHPASVFTGSSCYALLLNCSPKTIPIWGEPPQCFPSPSFHPQTHTFDWYCCSDI